MIKERALELVAALRSGKYKQTKGYLHTDKGFCCLGVATDLAGVTWKVVGQAGNEQEHAYYYAANRDVYLMSPEVMEYFGFWCDEGRRRDGKPIVIDGNGYSALTDANDSGVSFEKIADYIEANWEEL